jgi:hypothetical protein
LYERSPSSPFLYPSNTMASIMSNGAARELHVKVSNGTDLRRFRLGADEPTVTLEKLMDALTRVYSLNNGTPLHVRCAPPGDCISTRGLFPHPHV